MCPVRAADGRLSRYWERATNTSVIPVILNSKARHTYRSISNDSPILSQKINKNKNDAPHRKATMENTIYHNCTHQPFPAGLSPMESWTDG